MRGVFLYGVIIEVFKKIIQLLHQPSLIKKQYIDNRIINEVIPNCSQTTFLDTHIKIDISTIEPNFKTFFVEGCVFFQSAFAGSRVDYGVDKTVDYKPNDVKKSFRQGKNNPRTSVSAYLSHDYAV